MSYDQKDIERGEAFASEFSNFANIIANRKGTEAAIQAMCRDHRTLQQSMVGFCLAYLKAMSEKLHEGDYDPRNEIAVKTCARLVELAEQNDIYFHMPCI